MFRTRDFILIFTTIVFLLVAIGATISWQSPDSDDSTDVIKFVQVSDKEFATEVYEEAAVSREERLAIMRSKIAEGEGVSLSSPEIEIDEEIISHDNASSTEDEGSEVEVTGVLKQCPGYSPFVGLWSTDDIEFEEVEGALIVYRELLIESLPTSIASSTTAISIPEVQREVLLQLPIRTMPMLAESCIKSDVVGIAQDGSLVRNNEAGLYGVFGSGTVIGHALDGFPIYGVGDVASDECGGATINGQYGYYLSDNREVILNCFSATPVPF